MNNNVFADSIRILKNNSSSHVKNRETYESKSPPGLKMNKSQNSSDFPVKYASGQSLQNLIRI